MDRIPAATEVFEIFKQLNNIPRPSWHEEKAADFLCAFAERLSLDYERDANNCVIIRKAATKGYEKAAPVALLNHADMVCVAEEGTDFNPLTSPIATYIQDGWIKAHSTSLGADNGIGLAMALAILQSEDIPHPALEVITTTNEEDGMTGAANLSADFLKARKIINLDSEDYDTITLGSAGALLQESRIPFTTIDIPCGQCLWEVIVSGGLGGHSGVDINKHRTNANSLMADFLHTVIPRTDAILVNIEGGNAGNSIATKCKATIAIQQEKEDKLLQLTADFQQKLTKKHGIYEPELRIQYNNIRTNITEADGIKGIERNAATGFVNALHRIPQGVLAMREDIPGTVETSNNTGCVRTEAGHLFASNYSRSFSDAKLTDLGRTINDIFAAAGGQNEIIMMAPAWQADINSPLVSLAETVFHDTLGFRPHKVAMHFALEAGYFMKKYPGTEMISIGPKIIEPHSTAERVSIESVNNIWAVLKELLARMR